MAQPVWVTPPGSLGTIAEGIFYQVPLLAFEPDSQPLFYQIIAGSLPAGIQVTENGLLAGIPQAIASVQGVPTEVNRDVTSKFAIRAFTRRVVNGVTVVDRLADRTFTLTVTGQDTPRFVTPNGLLATYLDGTLVSGLQIQTSDPDPGDVTFVRLVSGDLPKTLTVSRTGLISGFIDLLAPQGITQTQVTYSFTLEVTDGKSGSLGNFQIRVLNRELALTADTTVITADNTFITADNTPEESPSLLTPPGSIGTVRSDNYFAFQFQASDAAGDVVEFIYGGTAIPGLTLDPATGWLYGFIPDLGIAQITFNFTVRVRKLDNPVFTSDAIPYSLTVTGPLSDEITWITDSDLGSIDNGATSTFFVRAISKSGLELQYQLLSGSDSNLPQGLQLLENGDIAGRVSFNTFALDGGTTTFDVTPINGISRPTTFDMVFTFTVQVFSVNGVVNTTKTFSITVVRAYNEPYENLYIQAMPPQEDRDLINNLLQNSDIFPPSLLYRPTDPNFGVSRKVIYDHAFGLTSATIPEYYSSLYENHYWKNLVLGQIRVAQATNAAGEVIYEVVYSQIIDDLVNNQGQSVNKQVDLAFPVNDQDSTEVTQVYPNSLVNMRTQVIDTVGQVSNVLPLWMTSKQANGQVLGFVPAWVIAYARPGKGAQIAYNIAQSGFGQQLNLIDFEVDRYELDRLLSKNWDSATGQWIPTPPTVTTFDASISVSTWTNSNGDLVQWVNNSAQVLSWYNDLPTTPTIFDGGSLQFIDPVDMYSNTTAFDKYLVFPKRTILG